MCGLWLAEDGVGKVFPRSVRLVADVPGVQKLLDVHNRTRGYCPPSRQPSQPGLAPYPAATADGLTGGGVLQGR